MSARPGIWDGDSQARLEELALSRVTAAAVAAEFGTTRSAILGRAHRTGVKFFGARTAKPPQPKPPRAPRAARPPRPYRPPGRQKGQYFIARDRIIQALAHHLAGWSQERAAKAFRVSAESIGHNWKKDSALCAEAQPIADELAAKWAGEKARCARILAEIEAAQEEKIARANEAFLPRISPRYARVLAAVLRHRNMAAAADELGLTRERVRQIVAAAEGRGFINPMRQDGGSVTYRTRGAR